MAGRGHAHLRDPDESLLRLEDVVVNFKADSGQVVQAVSGVSLDLVEGETVGLVGESGCGKSTIGRSIVGLPRPTAGSVRFEGQELTSLSTRAMRAVRQRLQIVLQDPTSSLNPRRSVRDIVLEGPAIARKRATDAQVSEVLEAVGLDPSMADRKPHQFSGGQCQRISIARALMMRPKLMICDEPVSALDVSVQAQILNLLEDLKDEYGLTMLFIAHDLAVVKSISDRIVVMYLGKVCEVATSDALFATPRHPYTTILLDSIPGVSSPVRGLRVDTVRGEMPSPIAPPSGCRFHTRCPRAESVCREQEPELRPVGPGQFVACHLPNQFSEEGTPVAVGPTRHKVESDVNIG